jgi:transposase
MVSRKKYDLEFKDGAVRLVTEQGQSVAKVARDLGINENMLHRWIKRARDHGSEAFPGSGNKAEDDELARVKEELRITRMERDILKKTIAYFAERPK